MKKNRSTLKDYFKKGAIPTEANFADLIDSMLNQEEDNIAKLPNDPLKITATGTDEALVNFYRIENNAEKLSWQVKQKLGGVAGLSISDAAASRLFIENGTGNLGVGITKPAAKLHISGAQDHVSLRVGYGDTSGNDFTVDVAGGQGLVNLVAGAKITPDGGGYTFLGTRGASKITLHDGRIRFHTSDATSGTAGADAVGLAGEKMTLTNDGKLGIGTSAPGAKLHVSGGQIQLDGNQKISFSDTDTSNNLKIQLWSGYGLGINGNTLFYAANGQHSWRDNNGTNERMLLTTGADGGLTVKGTGNSSFAGNVGIGTTTPRTQLDTRTGVLSGAANDYVKAQFNMSGGGTVTWGGPGGRLKWTTRFVAISMEKSVSFASGFVDMDQPTSDIPAAQVYDGTARSATAAGVILNGWEALYAVHTVGGDNKAISYRIVKYTNNINAPSNWILVALANDDDKTVRLGTGVILSQNSSSSQSSPIPQGVITMWSGAANNVPGGWALCNGANNTPNLLDKFIVAAGANYAVGATGGADTVILNVSQMPSHNHTNGDYNQLLTKRSDGKWTNDGSDTTSGEPDIVHSADMQSSGGNQAHENRPPYYALAYIMKL